LYPVLSIEMLRVGQGQPNYAVRTNEAGLEQVIVGDFAVPTDSLGQVWVRYARWRPEPYLPVKDGLQGMAAERIKDKVEVIGTSGVGVEGSKATRVEAGVPGVEVHAQLIETIRTESYLSRPGWAPGAEAWLLAAVGLLMIIAVPVAGARWGAWLSL